MMGIQPGLSIAPKESDEETRTMETVANLAYNTFMIGATSIMNASSTYLAYKFFTDPKYSSPENGVLFSLGTVYFSALNSTYWNGLKHEGRILKEKIKDWYTQRNKQ